MGVKIMNILYEDNHIIVAEKEVNILSQADNTNDKDMLSMVKKYIKEKHNKPGNVYLGLVHRLDRPVGGCMVFAKTSKAASRLSEQVRNRSFEKTYLAVIRGTLNDTHGTFKDYLYKDTRTNMSRVVDKNFKGAKEAILEYEVLGYDKNLSLVKIKLKTGRPHQIRVQLSSRGNALYGDQRYGEDVNKHGQQIALWSYEMGITHPTLKEDMKFRCMPPKQYPWNLFDI
ncbi:RluA family pseudouridine synthase [Tepidibacter sp. Z1-5]|uniref:RluA family pseudouridine synthase n=1 Tax=Tepidibacter sp. Z1-5 TaxID=3134138 RepID=UPI0030BD4EF9